MTRRAQRPTSTTGGPERLTNGLALLALVAIGVVWPPLELSDARHGSAAKGREVVVQREAAARPRTDAQRQARATRTAGAPARASRRDAAVRSRPCIPEELGAARAPAPAPVTIGPPRA